MKTSIRVLKAIRITVAALGATMAFAFLLVFLASARTQAAPLRSPGTGDDPEIRCITMTSDLPHYDPMGGDGITKTVYFSNAVPGVITLTFGISGTPTLTLTAGAAFDDPERVYTSTDQAWSQVVTYSIATTHTTQPNILHTATNTNSVQTTVAITCVQDITAPTTGNVVINGGATYVAQTEVTLALFATDTGCGVAEMCINDTGAACTVWESYNTAKSRTLTGADGIKTVYVWFRDHLENASGPHTDSIILDRQSPINVTVTAPEHISATQFTVSWSANDATSGVASYTVEYSGTAYTAWQPWLTGVISTEAQFDAPATETDYIFRVTAYDQVGNSADATTTTRVGPFYIYLPLVLRGYPETGVIRVAPSGNDVSGCGSSTSPCQTIQYAVNLAQSGNTIKVAEGTYIYSGGTPHDDCSLLSVRPPVVCVLNKHLTLRGGYSTNNWHASDLVANPTIIDGQDWYRGVTVVGWSKTEAQASLEMEGFTIYRGLAQGGTSGEYLDVCAYGGGMFAYKAPVVLKNLIFTSNKAVGGNTVQTYGGYGVGGGLAIDTMPPGANCTLENVTFDGNEANGGSGQDRGGVAIGGGLSIYDTTLSASDITLTNNIAAAGSSSGNGWDTVYSLTADALGGGAAINTYSNATLQRVTATGNQALGGDAGTQGANDQGGAAHAGALYAEKATMSVVDSDICENLARSGNATNSYVAGGGGIMGIESNVTVERSMIISNTARGGNGTTGQGGSAGGGGIYLARFNTSATASIVNSVIADNYVEVGTGGTVPGGGGGGLWLQGVEVDIIHCTIAGNQLCPALAYGQAVLFLSQGAATPTTANFSYNIVADHTNDDEGVYALRAHNTRDTVNLNRGLFANNDGRNTDDRALPEVGTYNGLGTMLSDSSAGFVSPGSPDYDYHILASSAAKDQATGSTTSLDIDGQSRPNDGVSDIGADEYWRGAQRYLRILR